MDSAQLDIEKAWEKALGDIFQPYVGVKPGTAAHAMAALQAVLSATSHDIRRHLASTAARQGATSIGRFLVEEDWRRPGR
jgi:hypothetical protein